MSCDVNDKVIMTATHYTIMIDQEVVGLSM